MGKPLQRSLKGWLGSHERVDIKLCRGDTALLSLPPPYGLIIHLSGPQEGWDVVQAQARLYVLLPAAAGGGT